MNSKARMGMALALATLLVALPVFALEYPLSPEAIREAFFLGKKDAQKRATFLAQYTQTLPMPETGPHVAMIQFETPFAVIVKRVSQELNMLAPDAQEEFLGKPAACRVFVEIDLTTSYSAQLSSPSGGVRLRSSDFWKDFTFQLMQDDKKIPADSVRGQPFYTGSAQLPSVLTGAYVTLEYDAEKITSGPIEVKVGTPDGQDISATFDLDTLR